MTALHAEARKPELGCLVIQPDTPVTMSRLQALLPQALGYLPPGASFRDAEPVIRAAAASHGLVLCDAWIHYDADEVRGWPERLAGQGVRWLALNSHVEHLEAGSRERRVVLRGTPGDDVWGTATLVLDRFVSVPPGGLRIVSEAGIGKSGFGYERPLTRHLLRSGFAPPRRVVPPPVRGDEPEDPRELLQRQLDETAEQVSEIGARLAAGETALVHVPDAESPFGRLAAHRLRRVALAARAIATTIELTLGSA